MISELQNRFTDQIIHCFKSTTQMDQFQHKDLTIELADMACGAYALYFNVIKEEKQVGDEIRVRYTGAILAYVRKVKLTGEKISNRFGIFKTPVVVDSDSEEVIKFKEALKEVIE